MNWTRTRLVLVSLLSLLGANASSAEESKQQDSTPFEGTWLFDKASQGKGSRLSQVWYSQLTVKGDRFSISKFMDLAKPLAGKFVFNSTANPKTIDLKIEEYDLAEAGMQMKIPSCTLPGIYQIDGDRVRIHFPLQVGSKRPESFETKSDRLLEVELVKVPGDFKEFPKQVSVKVLGMDGKPTNGVTIAGFMSRMENREKQEEKPQWTYYESAKTGPDGIGKIEYEKLRYYAILAHDAQKNQIAIAPTSPVLLLKGETTITLKPACRISGDIVCEQLKKLGRAIEWTNVYLLQDEKRIGMCSSFNGKFEFIVPPGTYTLNAYGEDLKGKDVNITVAPNKSTLMVEPISLKASKFVLLRGQPAPELEGVMGWKGEKVKLADLKGKYVLLEFWGYWCGPCVHSMPILIDLHEKYSEKGLAIIGVHLDSEGEVDTEAKLDEKLIEIRKELWKGKDMPFPSALINGAPKGEGENRTRGGAAEQYGILSYPTTILIDREGKVVGKFHARDVKAASEEIEKLLKKGK